MVSPNGQLTAAELTRVSAQEQLSVKTAIAYRNLVAAGAAEGLAISISSPGGGYRDLQTQREMREGSLGNVALARKWDLNPNSSVPLASAGYSTHGWGTRVDLLFNGSSEPSASQITFAGKFGFTREFGADDPNHFEHDGVTAITEKDHDMLNTDGSYSFSPKEPLVLSTTAWKSIPINTDGDFSFVKDFDGFVHIDVATRVKNLPAGATVQGRFQIATIVDSKVTTVAYTDVYELHGSGGDSFPGFSDGAWIHKNQRLRLMMLSQQEGAAVARTSCTVMRFARS